MKTTLDLNDALLVGAKALAAQQRTTLTRVVEEGIRMRLERPRAAPRKISPQLPVFHGKGGFMPGVDGSSNRSMLEAADGDDS